MQVGNGFPSWLDGSSTMPYASKVAAKLKTARAQRCFCTAKDLDDVRYRPDLRFSKSTLQSRYFRNAYCLL